MVCVYVYVHLSIHTPQYQHTKPPTTTTPIQAWCQFYHQGATDCAAIKDAAVAQAVRHIVEPANEQNLDRLGVELERGAT